jgi:L-iditol 2-dehydrogenase
MSSKRHKATPTQRALILKAQGEMGIGEYPISSRVPPDHVRVRIVSCGLCASDDHYLRHGRIGNFVVNTPMVLGHEVAGVVAELGADVSHLSVGDKVAIEPGISCAECARCREGSYNLCPRMIFFATPPINGALCSEVVHPARLCFRLPPPLTTEHGAMCEPLSVAVYAVESKARVRSGEVALVFGAGPIGVLTTLVASANGAHVINVDTNAARLAALKDLVPTVHTLEPLATPEETAAAARAAACTLAGEQAEIAASIDCTGAEPCLRAAIFATRPGGVMVMIGLGRPDNSIPTVDALSREVRLEGCFRYRDTWPRCIELMASGSIPLDRLVTHRYEFTDEGTRAALDACHDGRGADGRAVIKCMIRVSEE